MCRPTEKKPASDPARRNLVEPGRLSPVAARPLFQSDYEEQEASPWQELTGGAGRGDGGWEDWRVEHTGNVSNDSGVPEGFAKNAEGLPEMQV